jgi:site-specific DNA-methyltransferase (adenine-specific)
METLQNIPSNSVSSCITDPPYFLSSISERFGKANAAPAKFGSDGAFQRASSKFMNVGWDTDIAFHKETWEAVIRVLKPGAYIVAFSSSRTYGRMQVALEDAGFITMPMIGWVQSQGMPHPTRLKLPDTDHLRYGGSVLKPSMEPIYIGQKPMEGTGTQNYLKYGTGCVNVGAIKVGEEVRTASYTSLAPCYGNEFGKPGTAEARRGTQGEAQEYVGRWPGNCWWDGSDEVRALFPNSKGQLAPAKTDGSAQNNSMYGSLKHITENPEPRNDGEGSAARFFPYCPFEAGETKAIYYNPKTPSAEKQNTQHATVKPQKLMADLIKGWTPVGGTVLDPFAGSGSTGISAVREGFNVILCEKEEQYCRDIQARVPGIKLMRKKVAA